MDFRARNLIVGIDATNLRDGGGRTHLVEILRVAEPKNHGFEKIVVWGSRSTLGMIEDRDWISKRSPSELDKGMLHRSFWQKYKLSSSARSEGCDLLFVPGGNYSGDFRPVITMSRNMLPFEWVELKRFGFSITTIRLILLRYIQSNSFRSADGVIFLTDYAKNKVISVLGDPGIWKTTIPHGLNSRFVSHPKEQLPISDYSREKPFRIIYVSVINKYKHQWHVVEALSALRKKTGWQIQLDLVGGQKNNALIRLNKTISLEDPDGEWVKYHGLVPHNTLHLIYAKSDLGIFASSCENMPNILLELMAAGLPIASSDRGPMPEILKSCGVYFNPEDSSSIEQALELIISDSKLRSRNANCSFSESSRYSWARCANETFAFLSESYSRYHKKAL